MRNLLQKIFGKRHGVSQDVPDNSEHTVERPKRPRKPAYRKTGEVISWAQWQYLMDLKCWDFFEKTKLEILRKHYQDPVTFKMFQDEFPGQGHWSRSSFRSINDKLYDLRMPYMVLPEGAGLQLCIISETKPDEVKYYVN